MPTAFLNICAGDLVKQKGSLVKTGLFVATYALVCVCSLSAQSIEGDWAAGIDTGTSRLLLLLHVKQSAERGLQASFDSVNQNVKDIPFSSVTQHGANVNLASIAAHVEYQGNLTPDGNSIDGTWRQQESRPLIWKRTVQSPLNGEWTGTIDGATRQTRLVIHIVPFQGGFLANMDVPGQHASGRPVSIEEHGGSVTIEAPASAGRFEGMLAKDASSIEGTWTQKQRTTNLILNRASSDAQQPRVRPQNPVKPYPYKEENVRFSNPAAGITLAGTLTVPKGNGPFPAVLLIGGSGPLNRDEEIAGHRPFLVLADYLTRHGFEVLRTDKRGVGESAGSEFDATMNDFVADSEAGITFLRKRSEVNGKKVGLIGHSEGGLVASVVASKDPGIAFVVMMAAPGVPLDQVLPEQVRLLAQADGVSHEKAESQAREEAAAIAMAKNEADPQSLRKELEAQPGNEWPRSMLGKQAEELSYAWTRYAMRYDPRATLRHMNCPVLALAGSKDLQVPPSKNLTAIREALKDGGNEHFDVVEFPGLNHLFQPAGTGSVNEYGGIDVTIAPVVLKKIDDWIGERIADTR